MLILISMAAACYMLYRMAVDTKSRILAGITGTAAALCCLLVLAWGLMSI